MLQKLDIYRTAFGYECIRITDFIDQGLGRYGHDFPIGGEFSSDHPADFLRSLFDNNDFQS
jgi:hypothetical protein